MAKLELRIRRIETGEVLHAEFDTPDAARQWLTARPPFVEVLRVVGSIDPHLEADLRQAMRPLDGAEMARREEQLTQTLIERRRRADEEQAEKARDPDRPMVIRWQLRRGMWLPDETDTRSISADVREAVLVWIEERNGWVREREQHVATAIVTVWPTDVPDGAQRVHPGGQFVTGAGVPLLN